MPSESSVKVFTVPPSAGKSARGSSELSATTLRARPGQYHRSRFKRGGRKLAQAHDSVNEQLDAEGKTGKEKIGLRVVDIARLMKSDDD